MFIYTPQTLVNERIPGFSYGGIPLTHVKAGAFTAKIGTK